MLEKLAQTCVPQQSGLTPHATQLADERNVESNPFSFPEFQLNFPLE
jgi:hypothetical protein